MRFAAERGPEDGRSGLMHPNAMLLTAILLIGAFKMLIIWGNETITEGSDSVEYLLYASKWFYGYTSAFPIRGPVFPLWVAAWSAVGVPLRLATEAALLVSGGLFAASLPRVRVPRIVAAAVFACIALHPATFLAFDMPMSEGLFVVIVLLMLACAVRALAAGSIRWQMLFAGGIGLTAGLLLHERGNDAVLIYTMVATCLIAIAIAALARLSVSTALAHAGASTASAAVAVALVSLAAYGANYAAFGRFGPNEILADGQKALISSLVAINTGEPQMHRLIPVTNQALQIAYTLSPTLAQFRDRIEIDFREKSRRSSYMGASRTGIADQFDVSDILDLTSTVIKAAPALGDGSLAAADRSDALKMQIAREIRKGLDEGKARKRFTVYIWNLTSPVLAESMLQSLRKIVASMFNVNTELLVDNFPPSGSIVSPLYDEMASRRTRLISKGPLVGYIAVDGARAISAVKFSNNSGSFFARQGMPGFTESTIALLQENGFRGYEAMGDAVVTRIGAGELPAAWAGAQREGDAFYRVVFPPFKDRFHVFFGRITALDGAGGSASCFDLQVGAELSARASSADTGIRCFVSSFSLRLTPIQRWGYAVQASIRQGFNNWSGLAFGALLAAAAALLVTGWAGAPVGRFAVEPALMAGLLIALVVARVVFFSFIDATIFPIYHDRHMFASNIFVFPAAVLLLGCAARRRVNRL